MKQKFIIGRLRVHDTWDYYKKDNKVLFENGQDNHFVGITPAAATQFDTYSEAQETLQYLGVGIFKIDKIFINDVF